MPIIKANQMSPLCLCLNGQKLARYLRKIKEMFMMNKYKYFWRKDEYNTGNNKTKFLFSEF